MRILVTGALGHIGSRFIRDVSETFDKPELTLIDNMLCQRYCSLFDLPQGASYKFIEGDILKVDLPALVKGQDVVLHLAAITNAADSFANEKDVYKVNLDGARLVAEACIAHNVPLIFPSTTSVYGTQSELVDENCSEDELKPQSPYARSKLEAERMLTELGETRGLRFVSLRLGTIFGVSPGMRFHTAVNKFCWQAVMGQDLTVWSTALNQKRPYLDLGDACRALTFIINDQLFDQKVYNVLTNNATVQHIIDAIGHVVKDAKVKLVDAAIMNQLSYEVSCEAFKKLGFNFSGDLNKAVRETLILIGAGKIQH